MVQWIRLETPLLSLSFETEHYFEKYNISIKKNSHDPTNILAQQININMVGS
jgi:hypothetical protein